IPQAGKRYGFVHKAPFGGGLAVDILAHHRVIHRLAKRHQLDRYLGRATAGQETPIDLAEAERGLIRREGEVAPEQRAITATEAPAIDHRDRRLLVPT